ncbi:MAG: DUF2306 domain-containing protein [Aliihoeflea sp.]
MNFAPLAQADFAIQMHVAAAIGALVLGSVVLFHRKGDRLHRLGGRIWAALMVIVALSSFFIHELRLVGPWSPIHLVSVATLWFLFDGVRLARRGRITAHRRTMQGTFFGGLIVAGGFTFLPGRLMHDVMLADMPGSLPAALAGLIGLYALWTLRASRRPQT